MMPQIRERRETLPKVKCTLTPKERGQKGAAIRDAKKKARLEECSVPLPKWGVTISSAGDIIPDPPAPVPIEPVPTIEEDFIDLEPEEPTPAETYGSDFAAGTAYQPEPVPVAGGDANWSVDAPGLVQEQDISITTRDPDFAEVDEAAPALSKMAAVQALVEAGWSEDDAFRLVSGSGHVAGPAPVQTLTGPATPPHVQADNKATEDLRQEQIRLYQERMVNYVAPVLAETFKVKLKMKFTDYVKRWAIMESGKRRRKVGNEVTPEEAIGMMVARFWQNDADRHLFEQLTSGLASGPRDNFEPTTGRFQN